MYVQIIYYVKTRLNDAPVAHILEENNLTFLLKLRQPIIKYRVYAENIRRHAINSVKFKAHNEQRIKNLCVLDETKLFFHNVYL